MKKMRLEVDALAVQSFTAGERRGLIGTVRAFSDPVPAAPSDWFPCPPSGIDTGSMCTCGQSQSGQPESCDEMTCIYGC